MTGLEPHPIFQLPTQAQALAMGPEKFEQLRLERKRRMELEADNPLRYGFKPEIWDLVDDLLVDGNKVVLDLSRIAKLSPDGKAPNNMVDVPKEIMGAPEIYIGGSQRSSKSEYGGWKTMRVLTEIEGARTWSFADTGPISVRRQQPIFWKYLPITEKSRSRSTGKFASGVAARISYKQTTGFAGETFALLNRSQHWFLNYAQDIENVQGDQLDAVWFDELRNLALLKTLRQRTRDRGGLIIVTFTSIDENYLVTTQEYDKGSRTILEVDAELLPLKSADGEQTGAYEKVPRVKVAGPGSDGNQRANMVFFHITDNLYFGFTEKLKPGQKPVWGKERFYVNFRGARREKILAEAYGILTTSSRQMFPEFNEAIHVIEPGQIPAAKTCSNYHLVDPHDGRNWFMIWVRIDARGRWFIYREWPSFSPQGYVNSSPSAYILGIGDPGPWALPGTSRGGNSRPPEDGDPGPAQNGWGFGLDRYMQEILRCEQRDAAPNSERQVSTGGFRAGTSPTNPLQRLSEAEEILERWMDSRYGASPTTLREGQTTLIEQMSLIGLEFKAASGKEIAEGIPLIHRLLEYDRDVKPGEWSPLLGRLNEPRMKISRNCPNTIQALKEYTGRDKQHGALKEPIDLLRYAVLADLDYVGEEAFAWQGGGSY